MKIREDYLNFKIISGMAPEKWAKSLHSIESLKVQSQWSWDIVFTDQNLDVVVW